MYDAQRALRAYQQIPVRFVDVDLNAALEISDRHGVYAYDAYMLACAERLRLPLLTLDGGLLHVARNAGIDLVEVTT